MCSGLLHCVGLTFREAKFLAPRLMVYFFGELGFLPFPGGVKRLEASAARL